MESSTTRVMLLDRDRRLHSRLGKMLSVEGNGRVRVDWADTPNKAQVAMWLGKYDVCLMSDLYVSQVTQPFQSEGSAGKQDVPIILLTGPGSQDPSPELNISVIDSLPKAKLDLQMVRRSLKHAVEYTRVKRELCRKQKELDLLRQRYTSCFQNAAHGFLLVGPDWRIEYANPALASILTGHSNTSQGLVGLSLERFFPAEDDFPAYSESIAATVREMGRETREMRMRRTDGSLLWAELTFIRMVSEELNCDFAITVNDVTGRRAAESQVRRHAKRLSALRAIDVAITGGDALPETLSVLLDELVNQLSVDAADVLILNSKTGILEYAASRGFLTAALQNTRLPLGNGCAGKAALERRTVHIPDLRDNHQLFQRAPYLAEEGFVTYLGVPLMSKGKAIGVLEVFKRERFSPEQEWHNFLEALAGQAAIAVDGAILLSDLERSRGELETAYEATLEGWSRTMELRDYQTNEHANRVADMTVHLARETGVADTELLHVRRGALLHDIGKIGVPDSILHKPGPLDVEEREVIQKHPLFAYQLLSQIPFLRPSLHIPYCHHEKWDGTGYPQGLAQDNIPLSARIFAVVDVFDALQSDRPYRDPWPRDKALSYIEQNSGRHFDPRIVKTFLDTDW